MATKKKKPNPFLKGKKEDPAMKGKKGFVPFGKGKK